MNNNQRKIQNAFRHNAKYQQTKIDESNNAFLRLKHYGNFIYFAQCVHQLRIINQKRKDMYTRITTDELPKGLTQEILDKCIAYLNEESSRLGTTLMWHRVVDKLLEDYSLNSTQASYIFVRWTEYIDNRKTLAKAIDFD